jgi:hypothetical protein
MGVSFSKPLKPAQLRRKTNANLFDTQLIKTAMIEAILTSDIGYTCKRTIDNLLVERINFAALNFVNSIYLVSYTQWLDDQRVLAVRLPRRRAL